MKAQFRTPSWWVDVISSDTLAGDDVGDRENAGTPKTWDSREG